MYLGNYKINIEYYTNNITLNMEMVSKYIFKI